jgi:regulator of sigma E protease
MIWALLSLSLLVLFHELGHFLMAKLNRVEVEEFSIGFGAPALCKRWGETRWCLRPVPLGGYVKMVERGRRGFDRLSPIRKISILLGGPVANFIIGYLLIYGVIIFNGVGYYLPVVGKVVPNTPASHFFKPGDRIVKIDNLPVKRWGQIPQLVNRDGKLGRPVQVEVERGGRLITFSVKPAVIEGKTLFGESVKRYILGIEVAPDAYRVRKVGVVEGVKLAAEKFWEFATLIWTGLEKLVTGAVSWKMVSGPIGIVEAGSKMVHYGWAPFLMLTALISINLGVLNLLPIPVLDGGGILFQLYRLLTGRELNPVVERYLIGIGILILVAIMGLGLFNDIHNLLGR